MTGFVLDGYDPQGFYCEMLRCAATAALRQRLEHLPLADFQRRTAAAAQALYDYGITFTLYSESSAIDRGRGKTRRPRTRSDRKRERRCRSMCCVFQAGGRTPIDRLARAA